jgi:hypothetical protein
VKLQTYAAAIGLDGSYFHIVSVRE